jgi:DNA processing protein
MIMTNEDLKYLIALTFLPMIGSITARKLIAYTGSAEAVFSEKKKNLLKIPGIGRVLAENAMRKDVLDKAEQEIDFIRKKNICVKTIFESSYPERLKQCVDAPLILFYKGLDVFNPSKVLSVVGTRNASEYGIDMCQRLIRELSELDKEILIVSGLAYGIDYQAHVAALKNGLKTIAVLAHGLHTLYPYEHRNLASKIEENGTLVTDFTTMDNPERNNFLKRNRIIAGLADATIIIESGRKGGALITADLALSYNRDVLAIPGRITDPMSEGCNALIRENKAALIEGAKDIEYLLGWDKSKEKSIPQQTALFIEMSPEEEIIVKVLRQEDRLGTDIISIRTGLPVSRVSATLLGLEFKAIVSVLPGNIFKLN